MDEKYDIVTKSAFHPQIEALGLEIEERLYPAEDGYPEQYAVTFSAFENNHRTDVHFVSDSAQFVEEDIREQMAEFKKLRDAVDAAYRRFRDHATKTTLPDLKRHGMCL